eukprot:15438291-Alexandrium_andersonii.AAC.1
MGGAVPSTGRVVSRARLSETMHRVPGLKTALRLGRRDPTLPRVLGRNSTEDAGAEGWGTHRGLCRR